MTAEIAGAPTDKEPRFRSVLAGLAVSDIAESVAWYSRFFGRVPDMRPMPDVAEWVLTTGATLQLMCSPDVAGTGFTRLEVDDLDAAMRVLDGRGFTPAQTGQFSGVIRFADYTDPSGNEVSVVEALFDVVRFTPPSAV
ncbi:VOC family protein [Saccharomonospora sp. NPDC046836]|uniref:VOC family protein n=1 Tax=Saccharomonospora sp. NPDC046836 TaxID=3156921 RepID=UPI003408EB16